MDLLLGIDMGTGSTKGVLVDTAGVVVASATVSHAMSLPRPGWAEVDAESTWWREVCEISTRLTAEMPAGASLAAMCVSGVGPCLVLCDDALTPLRPAILYGVDTRATAEIASLTRGIRRRGDPGAGRDAAVQPGGGPEAGMGPTARAAGVRACDRLVRVELLHHGQADG